MDLPQAGTVPLLRVFVLSCLLQFFPSKVAAQDSRKDATEPERPFQVRVDAAVFRVRVTDKQGHLIEGMTKTDFRVLEGDDLRVITYFSEQRSAPVSLALLIDVGAAMDQDLISRAKQAVFDLVHALSPDDEILIGTFDDRTEFLTELTSDRLQLLKGLENLSPRSTGSRVALRSAPTEVLHGVAVQLALSGSSSETGWAVDETLQALKTGRHGQKAILAFSAGFPGLSESTVEHLRESRVHFFVAPVSNRLANLLSLGTTGSLQGKSVVETGGVQFPLWQTAEQIDSIRRALKGYYLIGFQPREEVPLRTRKVKIEALRDSTHHVSSLPVLSTPHATSR